VTISEMGSWDSQTFSNRKSPSADSPLGPAEVHMSAIECEFYIDASEVDATRLLSVWGWLLRGPFRLLGVSVFGDLFLQDADDSVKMLDLVSGEIKQIAICIEEFEWGLGDTNSREEWLMAGLARAAAQMNLRAGAGQCLAFQTPPILGGMLEIENLAVWDLYSYEEGLAKLFPQVVNLPAGTEIRIRPT
jgi:hypothetical protein